MIVEKHTIEGYNNIDTDKAIKAILDRLGIWDKIPAIATNYTYTYEYGNTKVKITYLDNVITMSVVGGGSAYAITAGRTEDTAYLNFIIVKTTTSVGFVISKGSKGESASADYSDTETLKFVLTKQINLADGNEEKGVVVAQGTGTADEHSIHLIADSSTTTLATISKTYTNANITVLQPATCATYTGYCPHVYIPVTQTCESSNSKATVNGSNFYILGGSLYLLDD